MNEKRVLLLYYSAASENSHLHNVAVAVVKFDKSFDYWYCNNRLFN